MPKIYENFWLKLTALALGLLLWFHVATEKVYKYELKLPVTEILLDSSLTLVDTPPGSLTVSVSATGKQLLRQKWRERGLRITANQYKIGRHMIQLNTTNTTVLSPMTDVTLDEIISPVNVSLFIDRVESKQVEVESQIEVDPGEGFAVGNIYTPKPKTVTLSGPRATLSRINSVKTEEKLLQGLRDNMTLSLSLITPDGYGLSLSPDTVKVTIDIVPVKTRIFSAVPLVIYNIPQDIKVTAVPSAIDIELTGPPTEIDLLNKNALTASTDYSTVNDSGYAKIKIDCPTNFTVKKASTDSVSFVVE